LLNRFSSCFGEDMSFSRYRFLGVIFLFCLKAHSLENQNDLMRREIKHVVVLVLENRSFDNLLGWLYSKEDPLHFIPPNSALPFQGLSEDMLSSFTNPLRDSSGKIVFSCPPIRGVPSTTGTKLLNSPGCDPNEPFDHVTEQIYGSDGIEPSMLGFLQDYASLWNECDWEANQLDICSVMETYTAHELPFFAKLARHYAVSDLWFSSVPTETNPNRAFLLCGTSEGQIVNGSIGQSTFQADTIWNRLTDESPQTSWTIFWQTDTIPEIFPGPFHSSEMFKALNCIPNIDKHYQKLDVFHHLARRGELPDFSFIEPQWTYSEAVGLSELCKTYPNSEYLLGIQGNDLHPPGDVRTGENLLANIYTSLIANEDSWNRTLFIVLFDEHGGIFDHVPPPASLAPDECFQNGFKFDRYGVRTPALFISPRIKKRTIIRPDTTSLYPFDHTSLLSTLLKWKNIDPSKWNMGKRTSAAPSFENVVTESIPRIDPILSKELLNSDDININMGDPIFLKNPNGKYLTVSNFEYYAEVGSQETRSSLQFIPSEGKLTHGSFVLVKLNDPSLSEDYVLDSSSLIGDCYFATNQHTPSQWWTVKSVDHPFLGYEIKDGDSIYLECHVYLDPLNFVPSRLATKDTLICTDVTTVSITDEKIYQFYWIIEKAPEKK
jgi:phospholipase C